MAYSQSWYIRKPVVFRTLAHLFIYLSIYLFIYLFIYLSIYLFIYLINLFIYLFAFPDVLTLSITRTKKTLRRRRNIKF